MVHHWLFSQVCFLLKKTFKCFMDKFCVPNFRSRQTMQYYTTKPLQRNLKGGILISRDLLYTKVGGLVKKCIHFAQYLPTFETLRMEQVFVGTKNNLVPKTSI